MKVREALVREMKSYNHLFEKAISDEIMEPALDDATERKKDRPDVQDILNNRIECKEHLRQRMIAGDFIPFVHQAIIKQDGYRNKPRKVVQPRFDREEPEQWLHHIVIRTLKPIMMKGMYEFSCGSIPKRGIHYGKRYLEKFIREGKSEIKYVLKFDIYHFYENVNVEMLKDRFRNIIHDEKMLKLIFYILDTNEYQLQGKTYKGGLLIGFYPSQWFANFFLQPFDHYIKEQLKVKCYVRYMDDCVIFGRNKKELHQKLEAIKQYLEKMDLQLKSNYQIYRFDYIDKYGKRRGRFIDFMGFKFYRDKTTIRKGIFARAVKTARRINKKEKITWFDAARMLSYKGWFKRTATYKAFQKYIAAFVNLGNLRKIMSNYSKRRNSRNDELEKSRKCSKARKH